MIRSLFLLLLASNLWANSFSHFFDPFDNLNPQKYPTRPNDRLTPGDLCEETNVFRYPERIRYCNRSVSSSEKRMIIQMYDRELGFEIERMDRGDFKIDHYIPLCAGGSNDRENLWPQHKSIYLVTDVMEPRICELMGKGKLTQSNAVEAIKKGKNNLDEVRSIMDWLNGLD